MKKQFIIFTTFIMMTSVLHSMTANMTSSEILNKFNVNFNIIFTQGGLFDEDTINVQKRNLPLWNDGITLAKNFVYNNSKNLVGIRDSDLIKAMEKIESSNIDLMNGIKITRNVKNNRANLQNQASQFSIIEKDMESLVKQINSKFFTISNKKEAQRLIVEIGILIRSAAKKAQNDINDLLR